MRALAGQAASLLQQSRAGVVAAMLAACVRTQAAQSEAAQAIAQALIPTSKVCHSGSDICLLGNLSPNISLEICTGPKHSWFIPSPSSA